MRTHEVKHWIIFHISEMCKTCLYGDFFFETNFYMLVWPPSDLHDSDFSVDMKTYKQCCNIVKLFQQNMKSFKYVCCFV